jgi:hypothetical protein
MENLVKEIQKLCPSTEVGYIREIVQTLPLDTSFNLKKCNTLAELRNIVMDTVKKNKIEGDESISFILTEGMDIEPSFNVDSKFVAVLLYTNKYCDRKEVYEKNHTILLYETSEENKYSLGGALKCLLTP